MLNISAISFIATGSCEVCARAVVPPCQRFSARTDIVLPTTLWKYTISLSAALLGEITIKPDVYVGGVVTVNDVSPVPTISEVSTVE